MPRARCRTVSTGVTEEEYALLEAASEKGNVGAWTRSTLLSAATIARPAGHDLVLAKVAALRAGARGADADLASVTRLTGEVVASPFR